MIGKKVVLEDGILLLQSRLPIPIRLNPNDDYDALEKVVKDLASKNAAKQLKDDKSKVAGIISEIEKLAKEVDKEISGSIGQLSLKIEAELNKSIPRCNSNFRNGRRKIQS